MRGPASVPGNDVVDLQRELAQREAELSIINSIQQGLASHVDVQSIYDLVGDEIRDIFKAQVVMISTYDKETHTMEHRYAIERGERVYSPGHHPVRGFRTQIVLTRLPVLVNTNVAEHAARLGQPTLPGTITPKSWLGVPMLVGDQVTGILSLQNVDQENAFEEADVRFLQTIASSMSLALENARLFDETQRLLQRSEQRSAELQIINDVQDGLAQKLSVAAVYELVGETFRSTFPQADLAIMVYDPATDLLSAPFLVESGERLAFEPRLVRGTGFVGYLLRDPHALLINEKMEQAMVDYQSVVVRGTGLPKSALYVPVMAGPSVRGAIVLEDMQREHAFGDSNVRLLETLANSMSIALENARLWEQEERARKAFEREFEIGREIQTSFLPDSLPQPKGWEIAASLRTAREVGGDFYDVFTLGKGRIGLVIADVCDKGLGAALFMTLFRSLIRAATSASFLPAGSRGRTSAASRVKNAMSLTNRYVTGTHGSTSMFATIFLGILDTETGALTYSNGGHPPPMMINRHGVKSILKRTGPAVGLLSRATYATGEIVIDPGDTLFAHTDGLTDTLNPAGESFSTGGLLPLFAENQSLETLLGDIHAGADAYSAGAQQTDDVTMLAVRRCQGA
jgi:serine phosphatase RsbU (regulator of sigma subunit)